MAEFTSKQSFELAINEVAYLINDASKNIENREAYLTYNKASLLLLASKFENFVENVIEEFVLKLNEASLSYECIPPTIKINHMKYVLSKSEAIINHDHKHEERENLYLTFSKLWISTECCENLSVDNKFSYGKHGPKELNKLFNNIGIENIFNYVELIEIEETMLGEVSTKIDFESKFAAFVNYRNQIIHQDFTPSLTHNDIEKYKDYFVQFSDVLLGKLETQLTQIINQ